MAEFAQMMFIMFLVVGVISIIITVIMAVSMWKLFVKADVDGWKAIIPLYNLYTMVKIAFEGEQEWLLVVPFLPLISIPLQIFGVSVAILSMVSFAGTALTLYIHVSFIKKYSSLGMGIGAIFVPFVIFPIVAFNSKYQYGGGLGPVTVSGVDEWESL